MSVNQGDRGPAPPVGDPALDKPKLVTDMCRNVDLPLAAFNMNHLVSPYFLLRKLREVLSRCHPFFFFLSFFAVACRAGWPDQAEQSPDAVFTFIFAFFYSSPFSMSLPSILSGIRLFAINYHLPCISCYCLISLLHWFSLLLFELFLPSPFTLVVCHCQQIITHNSQSTSRSFY